MLAMRRKWRVRVAATVPAGLLAVVCGGDTSARDDNPETTATVAEPSETESSPTTRPAASEDLPKATELDTELRHPNGTVFRLKQIGYGPTSINIDVEVINGFTESIELAGRSNEGAHLADDLNNQYNFVKPATNTTLRVDPGATLTGTLAFLGPIDPRPRRCGYT